MMGEYVDELEWYDRRQFTSRSAGKATAVYDEAEIRFRQDLGRVLADNWPDGDWFAMLDDLVRVGREYGAIGGRRERREPPGA